MRVNLLGRNPGGRDQTLKDDSILNYRVNTGKDKSVRALRGDCPPDC